MIDQVVLLDTGPIVALLHNGDSQHTQCVEEAKRLKKRQLLTTWPVLTEAAWLLRARPKAVGELLTSVARGSFQVAELEPIAAASWIAAFFNRYHDREPQLADASLLYIAERDEIETVFTLDERDFIVYRTNSGKALKLLPKKR